MIISFIQTKGGTGKTTLAKCLTYSRAFKKAFGSISFVELDPQGTIESWQAQRKEGGLKAKHVQFVQLAKANPDMIKDRLLQLMEKNDAMVLDVPGESVGGFATKFATSLSDFVFIPMRSSTNDEQSFIDNILPVIGEAIRTDPEKKGRFFIIPTFVHPQANVDNIRNYFLDIIPEEVGCVKACLPHRSVYENFSREGMNLLEYAKSVKTNARFYSQARKAVDDIEKIAKEILKLT